MRTFNHGKPGARLSAKIRTDKAENGGLRVDLDANYVMGLLSEKNVLGTAVVGLDGEVVSINDYYLTLLGYSREDFDKSGLNILKITPDEYLANDQYREEYRRTGRIQAFERPRYRKDGSIVWTLVGYAGLESNPDLLTSWALDITDKKRAEMTSQYLLEANKIMASSVELQPLLEKIAAVTLVNGFCDFCTIHFPEGKDRLTCRTLIHKDPELTRQVRRIIDRYPRYLSDAIGPARVIRTGKSEMSARGESSVVPENYRTEHHYQSIRALALKSYMSVPLFLNGKTIGALTLTSMSRQFDPEDLKTAEALAVRASQHIENAKLHEELKQFSRELERSNRDLTYYASIAAHDLKSPLATAQSYLDLILSESGETMDEQHRAWLVRAIESNKKLLSQVDRLLTFSHSNRPQISTQSVAVESVVRCAIDNLQREAESSGAKFVFSHLPTVKGDPTLLTLLFQNLFSNSIRYRSSEPLKIEIVVTPGASCWTFDVIDNGIGFDSQCAEKIFRLFERLPEGADTGGQGIGLATCRKVIEAHHGKIWAESTPGYGSKFSFTLPG
ncbi:MAG: ATP-binding protein [Bdellovibrionales bacterium]